MSYQNHVGRSLGSFSIAVKKACVSFGARQHKLSLYDYRNLACYWITIYSRRDELLRSAVDRYEPLVINVLASLDFLDLYVRVTAKWPHTFREMHRALCVLSSREKISVPVLVRLCSAECTLQRLKL